MKYTSFEWEMMNKLDTSYYLIKFYGLEESLERTTVSITINHFSYKRFL